MSEMIRCDETSMGRAATIGLSNRTRHRSATCLIPSVAMFDEGAELEK